MGDASAQRRNARGTSRHGPERSGRKMTTVNREQRKAERDFLGRLATRWGWRTQHYPRPRPMDRALIAAHGKALTMLATTIQAPVVPDVEDFAGTLGGCRGVVCEANRLCGDHLHVLAGSQQE